MKALFGGPALVDQREFVVAARSVLWDLGRICAEALGCPVDQVLADFAHGRKPPVTGAGHGG